MCLMESSGMEQWALMSCIIIASFQVKQFWTRLKKTVKKENEHSVTSIVLHLSDDLYELNHHNSGKDYS